MNLHNPEHEFGPKSNESERITFTDKFQGLLSGIEFEEPTALFEVRAAALEALTRKNQGPDFIQSVWVEYAKICEQIVDDRTETNPQHRAQLQIAILIHKALIFREAEDMQRYREDLSNAREYAYNVYLDEVVEAIDTELDNFTS